MNETGADIANKEELKEQETIKTTVPVDIAVVLPILPKEIESDFQIELDYDEITKAVNDYIERYTIDPRIDGINYQLSTPQLPDENATNKLRESLSGETDEIITSNEVIHVDNDAITDEKVTLRFELSVEENVYMDETSERPKSLRDKDQSENLSRPTPSSVHSTKASQPTTNQQKGELIIKSADSQLYWQNGPSAQLYWQNAPSNISQPSNIAQNNRTSVTDEEVLDDLNKIGSGLDGAMGSTERIESGVKVGNIRIGSSGYVKVGDNGRVYTNPYQRGNQYYKIVGNFSNNAYVRGLGLFGKIVSYGTTGVQMGIKCSHAETSQEKGRIWGSSIGKISSGMIAGAIASTVTSTVLVSIAVAAGVSTAPVTIVVIAGCSIMAGVAASNAVEQYGEDIGGNIGEEVVDLGHNVLSISKQELRRYKAKRIENSNGFRHSIRREK